MQGSKECVYYNPTCIKICMYHITKYVDIYNINIFTYVLEIPGNIQMWQSGSLGANLVYREIRLLRFSVLNLNVNARRKGPLLSSLTPFSSPSCYLAWSLNASEESCRHLWG